MTICIACKSGNDYVVTASDRMVTLSNPSMEYQQNISKTLKVADNCVISASGVAVNITNIYNKTMEILKTKDQHTIKEISDIISNSYQETRKELIEAAILSKVNLDFKSFHEKSRTLNERLVAQITAAVDGYRYGLDILVAGVDSTGGHIYAVVDPGVVTPIDALGNIAIGSGRIHATSSFIYSDYGPDLDLKHIASMTYEAKRRSEIAAGVGSETDMYVVSQNEVKQLSEDQLDELKKIYEEKVQKNKNVESEIQEKISELNI